MNKNEKLTLFLDTLGRTIIGVEDSSSTKDIYAVKNPAVLNIIPTQQQTMQVQVIPLVFKEVLADASQNVVFNYNRDSITLSKNVMLDFKISAQYNNIFGSLETITPPADTPPAVGPTPIKLFDEESK